jgi:hypothetical protein
MIEIILLSFIFSCLLCVFEFVDAPSVQVSSFQAAAYRDAPDNEEKARLAAPLIENVGTLGASGINLDGVVDSELLQEGHDFIGVLYDNPNVSCEDLPAIYAALGKKFGPTEAEPNLGTFPPGAEDYGDDPEKNKVFLRYGKRGDPRAFPMALFFPDKDTLESYIGRDDAAAVTDFVESGKMEKLQQQLTEASVLAQDAIAIHYFCLPRDYWRGEDVVTDSVVGTPGTYQRVLDVTTQFCQYLVGEDPLPEDTIFALHTDSGDGTIVVPDESLDPELGEDEYRLTIVGKDGNHVRPIVEKGHGFFQIGNSFAVRMSGLANLGKITNPSDLPHGLMPATPHYGKRGPSARKRRGIFNFTHSDLNTPYPGTHNEETGMPWTAREVLGRDLDSMITATRN